jgi:hypothetical protein
VRQEKRQIDALISRDWPWKDSKAILDEIDKLGGYVQAISSAFDEKLTNVLNLFGKGQFEQAYQLYSNPNSAKSRPSEADGDTNSAQAATPGRFKNRLNRFLDPSASSRPVYSRWRSGLHSRSTIQWMTERPRALAAAASILVVSIVGLQLEYLDSTSFGGSLSDWLSLLLWSAVVELSGVSVLDVVGRLSGGGPAPRSSEL